MLERTNAATAFSSNADTHLCVVHRDAGEEALPATCRHFPRLAVADSPRHVHHLSHYCPTAASMLFRDDVDLEVVERPAAFPFADYDGLTVTPEDLPPLLSPAMLMDPEGYSAWERHMVRRCGGDVSPESVVATLESDVTQLRTWRPGSSSLVDAIPAFARLLQRCSASWLPCRERSPARRSDCGHS
jgi:hypothetical protein